MPYIFDQSFVYIAAVVIAAGLIRGFAGFGSSMIMAPVLVHVLGPAEAVATNMLLEFIVSLQLIPAARKHVDLKILAPLGLGAWIGVPVGIWIVVAVDEDIMRRSVSIIILLFVIILSLGWRYKGDVKVWLSTLIGCLGGLLSGATSMGGPPIILYLMSGPHDPVKVRSTIILYFVMSIIPTVAGLFWVGVIDTEILIRVITLAPPFLVAAWVGSRLFHLASEVFFRRLTLVLLTIIALVSFFA
ncbi:MAG: sulfite exporter TauE/SafE family protein [Alphaproteobacteria bacterium]|nr:sulfite exporter TauE/SafE family protein [Alphaproteobacteria bacterium]